MKSLSALAPALRADTAPGWAFVLDADRTLGPVDTGREVGTEFDINQRIRKMFEEHGYTPMAFREHARIWSEVEPRAYLEAAERVAERVELHPIWHDLLGRFDGRPVFVVTAGIPQVWRAVLRRLNLDNVPVLGGLHSRLDQYFVTPSCKKWVVRQLRAAGHRVVAAGDSEIDLPMLAESDLPLWVPDRKGSPRLRPQLATLDRVWQVAVDERRFPPVPTLDADGLMSLLNGGASAT
jgi:phosphoserine phosphatase